MVNITLIVNQPYLNVSGHANSDEIGKDLVCCALSILVDSLSRYMAVKEEEGALHYLANEVQEGSALIAALPTERSAQEVRGAFEMAREGLRALADEYPEYIKLEEA
jgi:uncharacterized protein YsxB (DUF464 family)